jgi:LacI family transcriptional regulator
MSTLKANIDGVGPAYQRIADELRTEIAERDPSKAPPLASYRSLAVRYGVSLATIQQAIRLLADDGTLKMNGSRPIAPRSRMVSSSATAASKPAVSALQVGIIGRTPPPAYTREMRTTQLGGTIPIVQGIERLIAREGCTTMFAEVKDNEPKALLAAITKLLAGGSGGLILVCVDEKDITSDVLQMLSRSGVPVVATGYQDIRLPLRHVYYDHRHAAALATEHLAEQGCQSIMYFIPLSLGWVMERREGVRDAANHLGIDQSGLKERVAPRATVPDCGEDFEPLGYEFAKTILHDMPRNCGVVACNDMAGLGFMRAASERGLEAGRDYLIIGFDDVAEARIAGLSTIPAPIEDLCSQSTELLYDIVASRTVARRVSVDSHVFARRTSCFEKPRSGEWK